MSSVSQKLELADEEESRLLPGEELLFTMEESPDTELDYSSHDGMISWPACRRKTTPSTSTAVTWQVNSKGRSRSSLPCPRVRSWPFPCLVKSLLAMVNKVRKVKIVSWFNISHKQVAPTQAVRQEMAASANRVRMQEQTAFIARMVETVDSLAKTYSPDRYDSPTQDRFGGEGWYLNLHLVSDN